MLTLDVAAFDRLAFVVLFLAFTKGDDELDVAALGDELGRDNRHAGLFTRGEFVDLFAGGEQAARSCVDRVTLCLAAFAQADTEAGVT